MWTKALLLIGLQLQLKIIFNVNTYSTFQISILTSSDEHIIIMYYDDNFSVSSWGSFLDDCYALTTRTFRFHSFNTSEFTITISDSSDNVLCKYKASFEGDVDSSNILTFGAIDENFVRKTELDSKADKKNTHMTTIRVEYIIYKRLAV